MTITPQGQLYLCKTKLENDYKNQLTFSNASAQLSYFNSTIVHTFDNYTYMKKDNVINVGKNIDEIIDCNYLFYRNVGFTSKYYFCFITRMEYVNENCTAIHFETDCFQTWQFDITYNKCFVEREHVSDDTVGKHTIPENLETGEYICNSHTKDSTMDSYASDLCYVMASTSVPNTQSASESPAPTGVYNGIYTGLTYYEYEVSTAIDYILEIMATAGKTDAINGIFMSPKWLAPIDPNASRREVEHSTTPKTFNISVSKQTTLNGYTPKNNKLKCYPYNYLLVSNNIGQNAILHYEKFSNSNATFTVKGVLNPGCSINLTPTNYNGNTSSDIDAIQLGKFPICNFQNDMYTNWLTQNSVNVLGNTVTSDDMNLAGSILSGIASTVTNVAVGNYAGAGMSVASGLSGVANSVMQSKQHSMIPATVNGQLNSADVNVASGNNTFHFYKMSVKYEYAKMIDDYLSMFGYKVNVVKVPNITGRTNWNYVKTIDCNFTGDIPQEDLNIIRTAFNNGITLWHNASTMYNYGNSNNITS